MGLVAGAAKKFIPESKFKDILRKSYKEIWPYIKNAHVLFSRAVSLNYSKVDDAEILEFKEGILRSERIIFPRPLFRHALTASFELPGYFHGGMIDETALVIDAGAFPGEYTVVAARQARNGRVLALEPDPSNRANLKYFLSINNIHNVEVLPLALDRATGIAQFLQNKESSRIIKDEEVHKSRNVISVRTICLDDLLDGQLNGPPLTVKMDIEGAEYGFMEGAQKTLKRGAHFAIAAYHLVNRQQTHIFLRRDFEGRGYDVYVCNPRHLTLIASPKR